MQVVSTKPRSRKRRDLRVLPSRGSKNHAAELLSTTRIAQHAWSFAVYCLVAIIDLLIVVMMVMVMVVVTNGGVVEMATRRGSEAPSART